MDERNSENRCVLLVGMLFMTVFLASLTVGYKLVSFGREIYCGFVFIFPLLFFFGDGLAEIYGPSIAKYMIGSPYYVNLFLFCLPM